MLDYTDITSLGLLEGDYKKPVPGPALWKSKFN